MYQPISFNVIRQALDWHGFPVPTLRQLSYTEGEETLTAEYRASWPEHRVPLRYFRSENWTAGKDGVASFKDDLQACFAQDVEVREVAWSDPKQEMTALLYVTVGKGIHEWAEMLSRL